MEWYIGIVDCRVLQKRSFEDVGYFLHYDVRSDKCARICIKLQAQDSLQKIPPLMIDSALFIELHFTGAALPTALIDLCALFSHSIAHVFSAVAFRSMMHAI
jgi:hypothetical protein